MNVPFEEEMLKWKEEDVDREEFKLAKDLCVDLFKTTSFRKEPSESRASFPELNTLPKIVHQTIRRDLPYYEKLHKLRIQV